MKKYKTKRGKIVNIIIILLILSALSNINLLANGANSDINNVLSCLVIIGIVIALILLKIRNKILSRRYEKIYDITKEKDAFIIEFIEDETGLKKKEIIKALRYALKKKQIPYGKLCKKKLVFVQSELMLNKYLQDTEHFEEKYIEDYLENSNKKNKYDKSEEIGEIGKNCIYRIRESNALIDNPGVSKKLDKTEKLVSLIFEEAVKHPEKADNLGMFMNYYLPTIQKILKTYAEFEATDYESESVLKIKAQIEEAIDKVNNAFEDILDKMYSKEANSVSGEISALEAMLRQEGLN